MPARIALGDGKDELEQALPSRRSDVLRANPLRHLRQPLRGGQLERGLRPLTLPDARGSGRREPRS